MARGYGQYCPVSLAASVLSQRLAQLEDAGVVRREELADGPGHAYHLTEAGRTVLEFAFRNAPADGRRFWLVNEDGAVDMCLTHPGYEVDLTVRADLRLFVECWRGFRDLRQEIRAGRVELAGPPALRRRFPDWLLLHVLAGHPRKRRGRERDLAHRRR